jgi:hypothetical protein
MGVYSKSANIAMFAEGVGNGGVCYLNLLPNFLLFLVVFIFKGGFGALEGRVDTGLCSVVGVIDFIANCFCAVEGLVADSFGIYFGLSTGFGCVAASSVEIVCSYKQELGPQFTENFEKWKNGIALKRIGNGEFVQRKGEGGRRLNGDDERRGWEITSCYNTESEPLECSSTTTRRTGRTRGNGSRRRRRRRSRGHWQIVSRRVAGADSSGEAEMSRLAMTADGEDEGERRWESVL